MMKDDIILLEKIRDSFCDCLSGHKTSVCIWHKEETELVIEALTKQVPVNVKITRDPEGIEEPEESCPMCNNEIVWFGNGYCAYCGQRLIGYEYDTFGTQPIKKG